MSNLSASPCDPQIVCSGTPSMCGADDVFQYIRIIPRIIGGTVITWEYRRPSGSYYVPQFQVEVARGDQPDDEWKAISPWLKNTYFFTDPVRRDSGFYRRTYYRIAVKAGSTVRYSSVRPADSQLPNRQQQRDYNEILRRELRRVHDPDTPTTPGYLLKIRYHGQPCSNCTDPDTGMAYRSDCQVCFGVGYEKGYYPPFPCFNVDIGPIPHHLKQFEESGPKIEGGQSLLRYLNIPSVHPWDVWVDAASDVRFVIGHVQPITVFGVYPLICQATASQLPFSDPVYKIPVR